MKTSVIVSCEHAGNYVPEEYATLFRGKEQILESHRGWDPGSWEVAKYIATSLGVPFFGCFISRLLIETNRSLYHPQLFSEFTSQLDEDEKSKLLDNVYFPYRMEVEDAIKASDKPVLHLSVHSFTPVLFNNVRPVEIGILFDPDRHEELNFCEHWKPTLEQWLPDFRIKMNEPYKGTDDGFTSYLRSQFSDDAYRGVEIEINQKFLGATAWNKIQTALAKSLSSLLTV